MLFSFIKNLMYNFFRFFFSCCVYIKFTFDFFRTKTFNLFFKYDYGDSVIPIDWQKKKYSYTQKNEKERYGPRCFFLLRHQKLLYIFLEYSSENYGFNAQQRCMEFSSFLYFSFCHRNRKMQHATKKMMHV